MIDPSIVAMMVMFFLACIVANIALVACLKEQRDEIRELRSNAIERRYARYSPETGEWEWIEPPSEDQKAGE